MAILSRYIITFGMFKPNSMVYLARDQRKVVNNPHTLFGIMQRIYQRELMVNKKRRDFLWVLALSKEYRLFDLAMMPQRDIKAEKLKMSQVFKFALYMDASYIVIVQTAPTGEFELSPYFEKLKEKIKKAGDGNDIPLMEYMLITENKYYSFRMEGKL